MPSIPIDDAILASRQKASDIRTVCAAYDRILLDIRKEYQFPMEPERWAAGLAGRLELLNKDYRRTVRSNTQTLNTRLQNLYGRSATVGLDADAPAAADEELTPVEGLTLMLVSTPHRSVSQAADLMCDLLVRVDAALKLCTRMEDLVPQMACLYHGIGRGDNMPLLQRVILRRNLSKFQRGLDEASTYKQHVQSIMEEWRPYFHVLASETALKGFLDELHAQKVSKKAFLGEVTPVVERFRALRDKRDDVMKRCSEISLSHEAKWIALGFIQLPDSLVARELRKYDALLDDAKEQQVPHTEILQSLEALTSRSMSPTVIVGPDGVDINLSRLGTAYLKFREIHSTCNAVTKLALPLIGALERDIKILSELETAL